VGRPVVWHRMADSGSNTFAARPEISRSHAMRKILVTGASGFIGRHCVPLLASKGYEVHALSRRRPPETALPNVSWHELDLLRPGSAAELIGQVRPDFVLHLAWHAVPGEFWEARENLDWVRASLELLCAFADSGGRRIVAAGSCAEYGCSTGECVENASPLLPTTLYGTCKHALERILHSSSPQTDLSSAWGRVFFLYGPQEHPSRLVAYVVRSLLRGEPALCSEGRQILDFMHVEDAAAAFVALLESEVQGPVNIGSGRPIAVRDVLQEIGQQLGRLELIRFGARAGSSEPDRFWANTQRLAKEVGWVPHYDLTSGIGQTIEWWRSADEISACGRIQRAEQ
jgi:nucleoside-diphosphate-sugar epimerase